MVQRGGGYTLKTELVATRLSWLWIVIAIIFSYTLAQITGYVPAIIAEAIIIIFVGPFVEKTNKPYFIKVVKP
jgi:hypothetical protein